MWCISYLYVGDKPYLISGADDKLVKIWDYQTKACVQTLEGHTHNVSAAFFHPELPIIITGSEDGTLRVWHSNTYRPEYTLNYSMERLWSLSYVKGSNRYIQAMLNLMHLWVRSYDTEVPIRISSLVNLCVFPCWIVARHIASLEVKSWLSAVHVSIQPKIEYVCKVRCVMLETAYKPSSIGNS